LIAAASSAGNLNPESSTNTSAMRRRRASQYHFEIFHSVCQVADEAVVRMARLRSASRGSPADLPAKSEIIALGHMLDNLPTSKSEYMKLSLPKQPARGRNPQKLPRMPSDHCTGYDNPIVLSYRVKLDKSQIGKGRPKPVSRCQKCRWTSVAPLRVLNVIICFLVNEVGGDDAHRQRFVGVGNDVKALQRGLLVELSIHRLLRIPRESRLHHGVTGVLENSDGEASSVVSRASCRRIS
jgi:hypothetical protein